MKTRILFVLLISLLLGLPQSVKADTITYQVPGTAQVCQDPLAYDTFVFHKPIGFGSTVWYIGGTLIGSGDSIIFTPSAPGDYVISATWNSNVVPFMLSIYTAPPSHASFSVLSGGSMNSTNDTLWMCGTSVSVLSNTIGSEATSYTWYGPGGLTNSSDDPIILNVPGMHVFERINPCGVTRDTFYLVQLPTEAPVWTDMTFCNAPVNLTLDPGPGWNYSWYAGSLQVNMSNGSTMVPATSDIVFFDTGGKNGNYSNNENLVHTFTSANGNPLTVLITSLNLESTSMEHLIIYDGPNTSSPELFNATGSVAPSAVTSTGSVITVKFYSDFSLHMRDGQRSSVAMVPGLFQQRRAIQQLQPEYIQSV